MTRDEFLALNIGDEVRYLSEPATVVMVGLMNSPPIRYVTVAYFDEQRAYREVQLLPEQSPLLKEKGVNKYAQ